MMIQCASKMRSKNRVALTLYLAVFVTFVIMMLLPTGSQAADPTLAIFEGDNRITSKTVNYSSVHSISLKGMFAGPDGAFIFDFTSDSRTTWTSSNTSVATVSKGVVTVKLPGTTKITCKFQDSSESFTATCNITVNGSIAYITQATPSATACYTGDRVTWNITRNGGYGTVKYIYRLFKGSTSGTPIATTTTTATSYSYTFSTEGTYTLSIQAVDGNNNYSSRFNAPEVTVSENSSGGSGSKPIVVDPSMTVYMGSPQFLWATIDGQYVENLSCTSSDISIAKTNGQYIYGLRPGTVTITLRDPDNEDNTAQCIVTVQMSGRTESEPLDAFQRRSVSIDMDYTENYFDRSFGVFVPFNANYSFYTEGSSDTFGYLYEITGSDYSDYTLIATNDDGGEGTNFRIDAYLQSQHTYCLVIRGYNVTQSLTTTLCTMYNPLAMQEGVIYSFDIAENDIVVYSFTPTESTTYAFQAYGDMKTYGEFRSLDGTLLGSDDYWHGQGSNFFAKAELQAGVKYYLIARPTYQGDTGAMQIAVDKYVPIEGFASSYMELRPGEQKYIEVTFIPYNTTNKKIYYSAIDTEVASVDESGLVTAKQNGHTGTSFCSGDNGEVYNPVPILVHDSFTLTADEATADIDGNVVLTLHGSGSPDDYIQEMCFWFHDANAVLQYQSCRLTDETGVRSVYSNFYRDDEYGMSYFSAYMWPRENTISTNFTLEICFKADNLTDLWNTRNVFAMDPFLPICYHSITNEALPYYKYVTSPEFFTVTFPAQPTPMDHPDFVLPAETEEIDDEAFTGISARRIKLPSGVKRIGIRAFADCPRLESIYIPSECTEIALDAFKNDSDLTIFCDSADSYAAYYANERGINYQVVGQN